MRGEFLTVQECAGQMKVCVMTIYRLVRKGEIEAVRLNHRTIRIRKDSWDEYLKRNVIAAEAGPLAED